MPHDSLPLILQTEYGGERRQNAALPIPRRPKNWTAPVPNTNAFTSPVGQQHGQGSSATISVLLMDDHSLITDLVSKFLSVDGGFRIDCVGDLSAGLDRIRAEGHYDVVLLDVILPGLSGLQQVIEVVEANANGAVVLFSGAISQSYVEKAVRVGARGFIPKTLPLKALTSVIRLVASGQSFVPADFINLPERAQTAERGQLSQLETTVLQLLAQGLANKEIAFRLAISEASVKMHVRAICRKLGARNRTHAVILYKQQGPV